MSEEYADGDNRSAVIMRYVCMISWPVTSLIFGIFELN